jgi:hypothetical protein
MNAAEFLEYVKGFYTGEPLETGGTSIQGDAAPALRLISSNFKKGDKILDYGAGKYGRNSNYLRKERFKVYAYDPYNGSDTNGWEYVSKKLPSERFDVVFTCFVLNVVSDSIEDSILSSTKKLGKQEFHITRNQDIFDSVKKALLRKDKVVYNFFTKNFADKEDIEAFESGDLSDDVIMAFCTYGVQTSRGFQRIPFLEDKGYTLMKKTSGFKIYTY